MKKRAEGVEKNGDIGFTFASLVGEEGLRKKSGDRLKGEKIGKAAALNK